MICVFELVLKLPQNFRMNWKLVFIYFFKYVIQLQKKYSFQLLQLGNIDKNLLYIELPVNRTVEFKCVKTIFVRTTGHEKMRFTVVLSYIVHRKCLSLVIMFKQKTLPESIQFPCGHSCPSNMLDGWKWNFRLT